MPLGRPTSPSRTLPPTDTTTTAGRSSGDYIGAAFHDGIFYPSWADSSNSTGDNPDGSYGGLDVYVAAVNQNDPPVAVDDAYTAGEGVPLVVGTPGVLGNDSDPNLDPLTAALATPPTNGAVVLNSNGSFTYTTTFDDFVGTDSFTYTASDGEFSDTATVTITVAETVPAVCLTTPGAIVGTPGNDVLQGTPNNDVICGLGGNDVLLRRRPARTRSSAAPATTASKADPATTRWTAAPATTPCSVSPATTHSTAGPATTRSTAGPGMTPSSAGPASISSSVRAATTSWTPSTARRTTPRPETPEPTPAQPTPETP